MVVRQIGFVRALAGTPKSGRDCSVTPAAPYGSGRCCPGRRRWNCSNAAHPVDRAIHSRAGRSNAARRQGPRRIGAAAIQNRSDHARPHDRSRREDAGFQKGRQYTLYPDIVEVRQSRRSQVERAVRDLAGSHRQGSGESRSLVALCALRVIETVRRDAAHRSPRASEFPALAFRISPMI